jgi:ABC-type polysaccharide/polyol phosphate export permease
LDATLQMPASSFAAAVQDLREGVRLAPVWWRVAIEQTITRYRRTVLGPFWLASTTIGMAIGITLVFGPILGGDWRSNFPFVLAGLLVWGIVGGGLNTAAGVFLGASGLMQSQKLPLSFHSSLAMSRLCIDFAHAVVGFWVALAAVRMFPLPHWNLLITLPLVIGTIFCLSFPLGMLSTRFRDVGYLINFILQPLFLLTPVFWRRAAMPERNYWIVDYNPLAHLLEIVRQPLLGHPAPLQYLSGSLIIFACSAVAAIVSLMLYRRRVVFWL